jgi:hypothetical protein
VPAQSSETPRVTALPFRQRAILEFVVRYHAVTGPGCPVAIVAHHFQLHHETVRVHYAKLHRKSWLATNTSPAIPIQGTRC